MGLGNVIELSPLFLSLPTFFISLTFISVPDTYLSVGLQSLLLASVTLCLLSVLRFLGLLAPESFSKSVRARFRWIPLLVALVCVFAANNLLSPSRVMALLIIGALVSHSQRQFLLVFVLSLVWDLFACSQLESKLVSHTLVGYLLLAVPFAWFLSPGSVVAYPSILTAGVLSGVSGLLLLQFCMPGLHINVLALSVGSLVVTVLSQLETTTTEEAHFDGFFNKTLFVQDYKVNLFVINTVTLLIYHISLNTKATSLDVAFTTLKSHLCESFIDYVLIFVIRPSQPSRRASTVKADLEDGFVALLVQLFQNQETRSIFNFLLLNTSFMFVQLLYSFRSKSLSLLSDSLHMFLDCLSLFLGLLASLVSKRSKDSVSGKYPFGLSRIETLAGFANGSLLVGIVFGIFNESVRRIFDPVDLQRTTELLLVSVLGLLVNLVGIFAFNHGHDHDHGHSHSHSHTHSHEPSHEHNHEHSHEPGHNHEHEEKEESHEANNDNMRGIFLHILADTLGSVGVVVSTILIRLTGLTVLDPLTSILIATLIFASAVPLIKSSSSNLLLSLKGGDVQENRIRDMLSEIANTSGVKSYSTPRFWPVEDNSSTLTGYIHIQYYKSENSILIRRKVEKITSDTKLFSKLYVQYENEMDDCWCRNVSGVPTSY